jgi:nitrate reductase cytochrome c-type subunit
MKPGKRIPAKGSVAGPRRLLVLAGILGLTGFAITLHSENAAMELEGAPPVIPHAVRPELNCSHCHSIVHRPGSLHLARKNCQQCHVSLAANEQHLMLDIDWEAYAGTWTSTAIPEAQRAPHVVETYEGAPPSIPHSTVWANNCTDCHVDSMASEFSIDHFERKNCTQCHVSDAVLDSRQFMEVDTSPFEADWISPVTSMKQGRRNPSRKPNVIPHETEDMEDCLSCHAPDDTIGLATMHPERKNCQQCHVSTATVEGRKFLR